MNLKRNMKKIIILLLLASGMNLAYSQEASKEKKKKKTKTEKKSKNKKSDKVEQVREYPTYYDSLPDAMYAEFNTSKGRIIVKLHHDLAPITVANFANLAEGKKQNSARPMGKPFYDSLKFHRVISRSMGEQDFMIQGGDPEGNGMGGPGYKFEDEFHPSLRHNKPGILSMANSGPATNGSQFFITIVPTPHLDDRHSVFGEVVMGQEVVNAIVQNDIMQSVRIYRKGAAAKAFTATEESLAAIREEKKKKEEEEKKQSNFAIYDAEVLKRYPTAKKTPAGLWYVITKEGIGERPQLNDNVFVHYAGKLANGKEFDNSFKRQQPINFSLGTQNIIKGWNEGIALLNTGAEAILIIPDSLGYGDRAMGADIPAGSTLIFDVKLVEFKKAEPLDFASNEKLVLQKFPTAKKTPSGYYVVEQVAGTGSNPTANSKVKLHMKFELANDQKLDNSEMRGEPYEFDLSQLQLPPTLIDGITKMKTGGRSTFIIPAALGYGDKPMFNGSIPANSSLIFEINLLEILPNIPTPKK